MYFLNGDRLYIKPEKACGGINEQLENCLIQLADINSGKQIFKLNFFVDASSAPEYSALFHKISDAVHQKFSKKIILNLIAQPPLTCKIIAEVFLFDAHEWNMNFFSVENGSAILFQKEDARVLIGSAQSNRNSGCKNNAQNVFQALGDMLGEVGFPVNSIVRQWNYLEDIVGFEDDKQKYQEFNDVRSDFYGESFNARGFPAATGIGANQGGIIIEFVAATSKQIKTLPVDNPEQIAAHHYSETVLVGEECILKSTPKFERARYFELFNKKLIFISGTASIVGEKTMGAGDPEKQTEITIRNIQRLYSPEILQEITGSNLVPKYGHARVYVKNKKDFSVIKKTFRKYFGNLQVVYILADICRPDLLVEIEGKVILK